MKIYTRGGDDGSTALFGGPRVEKDHPRIVAYGAIDELNALLGIARSACAATDWNSAELDEQLSVLQHQLFNLGAELAAPIPEKLGGALLQARHVAALEEAIDRLEERLSPLTQFILPAGHPVATQLQLARCVCRRAEQAMVSLAREAPLREILLQYVNRLSDLLFVASRRANHLAGLAETPWNQRVADG